MAGQQPTDGLDTGRTGADLANLHILWLANNQLTGAIPAELGNLANLQRLILGNNQLTGAIPAELGNLANLQNLDLSDNELTGSIPAELGNVANLQRLVLDNNQLTGSIPSELGNLANLQDLWLAGNQLTGSIPAELGKLSNLHILWLANNQLTGAIPSELGNLANLQRLVLENNLLTGAIPAELGNLANLQNLTLNDNQLTGPIPLSFTNLVSLEFFWFHLNPGLCHQPDPSIRDWLSGIGNVQVASCPFIFVPVLLSAAGRNDSYFTSELTLTNRGTAEATLHYTYTAEAGGGNGAATDTLAPGTPAYPAQRHRLPLRPGHSHPRLRKPHRDPAGRGLRFFRGEPDRPHHHRRPRRPRRPGLSRHWPRRRASRKRSTCAGCARTPGTAPTWPSSTWALPKTAPSP